MRGSESTAGNRDILLEAFAAELTHAAYPVALRQGGSEGSWVDLELNLWRVLAETVKKWDWESVVGPIAVPDEYEVGNGP
jgi:hypothetical protein